MTQRVPQKRGPKPKEPNVDYEAVLKGVPDDLFGIRTFGKVTDEEEALNWVRSVFGAYEKSDRMLARDLGWNDPWRLRLRRLLTKNEGRPHMSALVLALWEGLSEKAGQDDVAPDIRGSSDEAQKARLRWVIQKYFGGIVTEIADKAGVHHSYIHHTLNDEHRTIGENLMAAFVWAGISPMWLQQGEGQPTWKAIDLRRAVTPEE